MPNEEGFKLYKNVSVEELQAAAEARREEEAEQREFQEELKQFLESDDAPLLEEDELAKSEEPERGLDDSDIEEGEEVYAVDDAEIIQPSKEGTKPQEEHDEEYDLEDEMPDELKDFLKEESPLFEEEAEKDPSVIEQENFQAKLLDDMAKDEALPSYEEALDEGKELEEIHLNN